MLRCDRQPDRRPGNQTAWRKNPTLALPPSGTAIDEARGRISDECCSAPHPLDAPGAPLVEEFGPSDYVGDPPELGIPAGDAVVVGSFDAARSFLTPTHLSIYTILRVSVDKVIAAGTTPIARGEIDVMKRGGRITLTSGQIIRQDYKSAWLGPQPGHGTYSSSGTRWPAIISPLTTNGNSETELPCPIRTGRIDAQIAASRNLPENQSMISSISCEGC